MMQRQIHAQSITRQRISIDIFDIFLAHSSTWFHCCQRLEDEVVLQLLHHTPKIYTTSLFYY